jgi:hypothetical protein
MNPRLRQHRFAGMMPAVRRASPVVSRRLVVLACFAVFLLHLPHRAVAAPIYFDGTFTPGDFAYLLSATPSSGNTVTRTTTPSGGIPGAWLQIVDTVAGNTAVFGPNIFSASLPPPPYDPSVSGPIQSIDFDMNFEWLGCPTSTSPLVCPSGGQAFGLALQQGGNVYVERPSHVTGIAMPSIWQDLAETGLVASDFFILNLNATVGISHQSYLDEFVFRFNRRRTRHAAFRSLLGIAAGHAPLTYKMLISPEAKA